MAGRVTTRDVLAAVKDVIESVEANSPNGDIKDLSNKVTTLCQAQAAHSRKQAEQFADVQSTILKLTAKTEGYRRRSNICPDCCQRVVFNLYFTKQNDFLRILPVYYGCHFEYQLPTFATLGGKVKVPMLSQRPK